MMALFFVALTCAQIVLATESKFTSLEDREKKLQEREQAVQDQMARHEKMIQDLKTSLAKERSTSEEKMRSQEAAWKKRLQEMEKELKLKSEELDVSRERQLASFLGIYEKMEPKQAAKVLESMDLKLATQIITQMKPQKAAEVMAKMSSERAKLITESGFAKAKKTNSQKVNEVTENSPIAPIGEPEKN
jgi:flagellar motility protein MotE (MotC chaperone)